MSIDFFTEIKETLSLEEVETILRRVGIEDDLSTLSPTEFSGGFAASGMSFFVVAPAKRSRLCAEYKDFDFSVGTKIDLRPTTAEYDACIEDSRNLACSLAEAGLTFIMSYQYEGILAAASAGELYLSPKLIREA